MRAYNCHAFIILFIFSFTFAIIYLLNIKTIQTKIKIKTKSKTHIPICQPIGLLGKMSLNHLTDPPSFTDLAKMYPLLQLGGFYKPIGCQPISRIAIIIPYRNRPNHLRAQLNHLHSILQRQQLEYSIFVVEQLGTNTKFNKAKLMNIAFVELEKLLPSWSPDCIILHDIDKFVEDDRASYMCCCDTGPRHLGALLHNEQYKIEVMIDNLGAVVILKVDHFRSINGFSNYYFGRGWDDLDLLLRVRAIGLQPDRSYDKTITRFHNLKHTEDYLNPFNYEGPKLLKTATSRIFTDGLSSLPGTYKLVNITAYPTYTWLFVSFEAPSVI
jgi:beta-1,4-galactosyltransferase 3